MVHAIANKAEWEKLHAENAEKVIVVDFTATWCGPCRMIGPVFEELSGQYPQLIFVKVDVDACDDVAAACGITAMPTFQVWKGGEKVEELVGASKDRLVALITKYAN